MRDMRRWEGKGLLFRKVGARGGEKKELGFKGIMRCFESQYR